MADYVIRFVIGGLAVSFFAVFGGLFKPKSFAGLFGASPAVALATLGMAFTKYGPAYVAADGRSMMAGAAAMVVYCWLTSLLLMRLKANCLLTTGVALIVWFAVAFGLWAAVLRASPA